MKKKFRKTIDTKPKRFQWQDPTGGTYFLSVVWSPIKQQFRWDVDCVYRGHALGSGRIYQPIGPGAGPFKEHLETMATRALNEHPDWSEKIEKLYLGRDA